MSSVEARNLACDSRTDVELVHRTLGGERDAFGELYRRYVRRIYNLVRRMLHDPDEVEDMTQEVFLQAYKHLPRFEERSGFYTWIYRVATNVCLQHRKSRRHRRGEVALEDLAPRALAGRPLVGHVLADGPELAAERRGLMQQLADAIEHLPDIQRVVMVLGPIQGRSYEEIAEMLGLTLDMVKGRIHRGRVAIRGLLERETPLRRARALAA